jgi:pantoate--beta-alanine ligase
VSERTPLVVLSRTELSHARAGFVGRIGVVMTMGALHEGHRALLRAARARTDHVFATIFVNPTQFGPGEDFSRYPRTFDADLDACRQEKVNVVYAPAAHEIYPDGAGRARVRVDPGPLATILEGAHRPGHFAGVLTVVLKLLHQTGPDVAFFGEKDYQQLTLVRAMVADLDVPVEVVGVATVRDADGLALSSRNRHLSASDRRAALALSRALRSGAAAARAGAGAAAALAAARDEIAGTAAVVADYVELTDPDLGPAPDQGAARLLVAARVGTTRLIDNLAIDLSAGLAGAS